MKLNFSLMGVTTLWILFLELIPIYCDINNESDIDDNNENLADSTNNTNTWMKDAVWQSMVEVAVQVNFYNFKLIALNILSQDYVDKVNRDRIVYNYSADPLQMNILLGDTVTLSQWVVGYNVNMSMWDMVLYGLGEIKMDEVKVERNSDLSQVRARIMVKVDDLFLTGLNMIVSKAK